MEPVFFAAESTNSNGYSDFITLVARRLRLENVQEISDSEEIRVEKPFLLYDGHSAHRTTSNQEYMRLYFNLLAQPPYSPCFNSIEWFWAHLKQTFKYRIARENPRIDNSLQLRNYVLRIA